MTCFTDNACPSVWRHDDGRLVITGTRTQLVGLVPRRVQEVEDEEDTIIINISFFEEVFKQWLMERIECRSNSKT